MKAFPTFAICLFLSSLSFADNSARIRELSNKGKEIQKQISQAQEYIQKQMGEILKIQGAIEELNLQDKQVKEGKDGNAVHSKPDSSVKKK